MAKKSKPGLLNQVATLAGNVAGSVEGGIKGTIAVARRDSEESRHSDVHYEASDINADGTFFTGAGLVAGLFLTILIAFLCFVYLKHRSAVLSSPPFAMQARGSHLPPEPRLQSSPRQDLKTFRAHEDWDLNTYHWINKNAGVVAIPIGRAMQIVAERGLPPASGQPNGTMTPPQAGCRDTGFEGKVEPEPR